MKIVSEIVGNAIGGIISAVVIGVLAWMYKQYRVLIKDYRRKKQELEEMRREMFGLGATKQEIERLREALKQAELQRQVDAQRIAELQSQLESVQQELERAKAEKQYPPMSDEAFLELCKSGDVGQVEEAIMNGANVNARDKDGSTALILANGHTEIVELLLKHGADVNARDNNGLTALMKASFRGYTETAEMLLKHGADVNAQAQNGFTALSIATEKGHIETLKLLRSYGAK